MKLAINPHEVECSEVEALADDVLIQEISDILNLHTEKKHILKTTLQKLYDEFLTAHYEVCNSLPEHEESDLLLDVHDAAYSLIEALNSLVYSGSADKRLADSIKKHDAYEIWTKMQDDENNPNFHMRRLISEIASSAIQAADKPDGLNSIKDLRGTPKGETKDQEALNDLLNFIHPNRTEERRERIAARKIPKDLPLRRSIDILKQFFESHVSYPFTAGKYYPELDEGFKSPAFRAVKAVLKQIYPQVSDRKIASIMQETNTQ